MNITLYNFPFTLTNLDSYLVEIQVEIDLLTVTLYYSFQNYVIIQLPTNPSTLCLLMSPLAWSQLK